MPIWQITWAGSRSISRPSKRTTPPEALVCPVITSNKAVLPAHVICQMGIARTFQIAAIFPSQTVLATILAGCHFGHRGRRLASLRFTSEEVDRAREVASLLKLEDRLGTKADLLSVLDRKRLMIAAALVTEPTILMLDEPVAGLTEVEGRQLVEHIEHIKGRGTTIMLIEHVMSILMGVSDRVMIMNQGRKIFEGSPAEAVEDREVVRVYLGQAAASYSPAEEASNA
jgi:branched-chain amino acid transport system ATP-binding protein